VQRIEVNQSPLLNVVEKAKDTDEQVDKVEIQGDCAQDKLVWTEFLGNDVSLVR
jgi:hypothetical protein